MENNKLPLMLKEGVFVDHFLINKNDIENKKSVEIDVILYGKDPDEIYVGLKIIGIDFEDGILVSRPNEKLIINNYDKIEESKNQVVGFAYLLMVAEKNGAIIHLEPKKDVDDEMLLTIDYRN
ncbi:MAG: hypothetical protein EOO50_05170 [Flavobacterium sp.]|uniref:hypothetical protein n=1 Tax=Flavobacterium sp. TaxID=239 RepID=UPI00120F99B9|nr:hypothetical protein [Flavobacterium sp.]RZJ67674.1 MAG: hypothetical protein EOO50_05170 [Flavobacterium sp.]